MRALFLRYDSAGSTRDLKEMNISIYAFTLNAHLLVSRAVLGAEDTAVNKIDSPPQNPILQFMLESGERDNV